MDVAIGMPLAKQVERLICESLNDGAPAWPFDTDAATRDIVFSAATFHGVGALLHERAPHLDWPRPLLQQLRDSALRQSGWELRHQDVLHRTLSHLKDSGIGSLLIKGTALAYSVYASAALRQRSDTDLLIERADLAGAERALQEVGFTRLASLPGEFVSHQANFQLATSEGHIHTLDVHWQINNSMHLASRFDTGSLLAAAQPLPLLSAAAFRPCDVDCLLIACMHRATHEHNPYYVDRTAHHDRNRLIWLYDIHLLAESLDEHGWAQLIDAAARTGLRRVSAEGIREASLRFHTRAPVAVLRELERDVPDPGSHYLSAGRLRQQWLDFLALRRTGERAQLLRELFFPPATYMSERFGDRAGPLPWLYVRRAFAGVIKRVRPTASEHQR